MQFKRLLLLLFSILIGFHLSQLTYWNSVQRCVFICQLFQATVTEIVLPQSESIQGFSILTGEDLYIFCFHSFFFFNFFTLFCLPFPDFFSYYSSYLYTISVIMHTAEKKRQSYHLGVGCNWNELVSFYVFMHFFFLLQFLSFN